jgi:WXG100 family type VII secretion target
VIGFRADLPALVEFVDDLARFGARAEQRAGDLDADVRTLSWSGAAAAAHRAARERWSRAAAELREALDQLEHGVATAHRNYAAAADANARMWS